MSKLSNNQESHVKQVRDVDTRQQVISSRALDNLTKSLDQSGLIQRLLASKEERQIAKEVRERVRDATVDQAI
jgi:hypothetical protein